MRGTKINWNGDHLANSLKCPTCKKAVEAKEKNPFLPFCCERCKLVDLGKWLDEKYSIRGSSTNLPEYLAEDNND